MGCNYYAIQSLSLDDHYPNDKIDMDEYYDEYGDYSDAVVHLGKSSAGWKFCWRYHNDDHYTDKESLLNFVKSNVVVDEYGVVQDNEEFTKFALGKTGLSHYDKCYDDHTFIKDGLEFCNGIFC